MAKTINSDTAIVGVSIFRLCMHFDTCDIRARISIQGDLMPRTFAYCRVSTADQTNDNQIGEIEASGFAVLPQRLVLETVSGSTKASERPEFKRLMDRMEEGDVLVVTKLDRLGRNAIDVCGTIQELASRGIKVHCLQLGGMDLTSSAGTMTMGVLSHVSQFERDILIERTRAGLSRAKAAGKALGRTPRLSSGQKAEVLTKRAQGASLGSLAKEYGVSRSAIQRVERGASDRKSPLQ